MRVTLLRLTSRHGDWSTAGSLRISGDMELEVNDASIMISNKNGNVCTSPGISVGR